MGEVDATDDYNIVINYKLLKDLFTKVACPNCNSKTMHIRDKLDDRMGLVHKLQFSCSNPGCGYEFSTYSDNQCNKINRKKQGRQPYEPYVPLLVFEKLDMDIQVSKTSYGP